MPQLSLYMDEAEMAQLRKHAKTEGLSLSSYARKALTRERSAWPENFWSTYGAITDESFGVPNALDESYDRALPSFDED